MCFLEQNQLLEVGWNKSEVTREDVEKSLNCCGFSSVNQSVSCPAVSRASSSFLPLLELHVFSLTLSCRLSAMLRQPRVLQDLLTDPAGVRRPGAALCGRHRPLLQLHRGQSVSRWIRWSVGRSPADSMPPVGVKLGGHLKALPVCSRFLACG